MSSGQAREENDGLLLKYSDRLHWQAGEQWKHCWELSWKCVSDGTQVSSQTENSRLCSDSRVSAVNSRRHFSGFKKPVNENSNCQTNYHQTHGHPAAADNNPSSPNFTLQKQYLLDYNIPLLLVLTVSREIKSPETNAAHITAVLRQVWAPGYWLLLGLYVVSVLEQPVPQPMDVYKDGRSLREA